MAVDANPDSGPRLIFHPVPEPGTANNKFRPILLTGQYDEETGRFASLGARQVNDTDLPAVRVTTFADPEGNGFDLVTGKHV